MTNLFLILILIHDRILISECSNSSESQWPNGHACWIKQMAKLRRAAEVADIMTGRRCASPEFSCDCHRVKLKDET